MTRRERPHLIRWGRSCVRLKTSPVSAACGRGLSVSVARCTYTGYHGRMNEIESASTRMREARAAHDEAVAAWYKKPTKRTARSVDLDAKWLKFLHARNEYEAAVGSRA